MRRGQESAGPGFRAASPDPFRIDRLLPVPRIYRHMLLTDSQAIKVATTYKYVADPAGAYTTQVEDKITSTTGGAVESGAESAQTAEGTTLVLDTTNTSLVANVDTSVIKGEVTTSATSVVFSMEQGAMYDCVLYIWIDGLTANDTAASGAFSVAVEFSGVEAPPAP